MVNHMKLNCIERPQVNNEAIGYFNGKLIVQNEWGELYYLECEPFIAEQLMDEAIPVQDLSSIVDLPKNEFEAIIEKYSAFNTVAAGQSDA